MDGAPADATPLHRSLAALRVARAVAGGLGEEGLAAEPTARRDFDDFDALGAVELEKTDCRPSRATPAVAPRTRAAMAV